MRSAITYNYDEVLEVALGDYHFQSFWKTAVTKQERLPIYHVHGFVPIRPDINGSKPSEIVFTEDQYHSAQDNAYSWASLIQIQSLSNSTGLMIGLSLSDRNMRRLLDAIIRLPSRPIQYSFLKEPEWKEASDYELGKIHRKAQQYRERFERSGVKRPGIKGNQWREEILGIIGQVERFDKDQQTFVFNQLGITPIWYTDHNEIPQMIGEILG